MECYEIYTVALVVFLKAGETLCEICTLNGQSKQCEDGCCDADKLEDICCSAPFWTWYTIIGITLAVIVGLAFMCFIGFVMCKLCHKTKHRAATVRRTISNRSNRTAPLPPAITTNIQPPPYSERDRHARTKVTNSPPPPYDYWGPR